MKIKKEYEKFFERKKNHLCVHDAEDVIEFAKHYQALQLLQTDVSKRYSEKDMDDAYDKGFIDGNQRDIKQTDL